ncbi:hypothetical protein A5883_003625 [Enterococcus sp. 5B3_DIV0040]|nr:hypothetical protein A5883_003625 [Enterococcus sp. 5B3_DIV0040]
MMVTLKALFIYVNKGYKFFKTKTGTKMRIAL